MRRMRAGASRVRVGLAYPPSDAGFARVRMRVSLSRAGYSARSATSGSTLVARRAGRYVADSADSISKATTAK
jgi:hypothetical protein